MSDFKAELKALKERRAEQIGVVRARVKVQNKDLAAIKSTLKQGAPEGMTVPDIAAATGLPADQVLWYVTAMRKYGQAVEGDQDGGYFRYRLDASAEPAENVEAE
jgi:predicted transcriptional regulator